jgi:hypothetical protein
LRGGGRDSKGVPEGEEAIVMQQPMTPLEICTTIEELVHATRQEQRTAYQRALLALADLVHLTVSAIDGVAKRDMTESQRHLMDVGLEDLRAAVPRGLLTRTPPDEPACICSARRLGSGVHSVACAVQSDPLRPTSSRPLSTEPIPTYVADWLAPTRLPGESPAILARYTSKDRDELLAFSLKGVELTPEARQLIDKFSTSPHERWLHLRHNSGRILSIYPQMEIPVSRKVEP